MPLDIKAPAVTPDTNAPQTRAQAAKPQRIDGDDRRVSLAVSSEAPVKRAFGDEILSHERGAIDLEFFGSGRAPLLVDHDGRDIVGVIERVTLDATEKVLRAVVRFGKSARASEVLADVQDGIRCNTSVQYRVHEWKPLPNDAGYRITKWSPLEVSIVSIPADPSVGVGRSELSNPKLTKDKPMENESILAERQRIAGISDLGERYKMPPAEIRSAIEGGTPMADWRGHVLDKISTGAPISTGGPSVHTRQQQPYSLGRVIAAQVTGDWQHAGFEREVAQELAARSERKPQGILVPPDALAQRAVLASGDVSNMFGTEHMGGLFIESLKPNAAVAMLGATMLTGLAKDVSIPKWLTGSTVQWIAENTAPLDSAPTTDSVTLAYHQLSATGVITRKVAVQADPSFDMTFRADVMRQFGVEVDRAAIRGSGMGAEPRGVLNTPGIGSIALGANGDALSWSDVVSLMAAVESENITGRTFGWLTNHLVKAAMLSTERATGTAKFILDPDKPDQLLGKPAAFSGNVPSDGTKGTGTDLSALIYGNWSDLLIGQFGPLDVLVDPYSESAKGNVRISVHSAFDMAVRYPEAFAAITDIATV